MKIPGPRGAWRDRNPNEAEYLQVGDRLTATYSDRADVIASLVFVVVPGLGPYPPHFNHGFWVENQTPSGVAGLVADYGAGITNWMWRGPAAGKLATLFSPTKYSLLLVLWSEVAQDFDPEYYPGKPEWGEVCL